MIANRISRIAFATGAALCASACAQTGTQYPSLDIRDAERAAGTLPVDAAASQVAAPSPLPVAAQERTQVLIARAKQAHAAFLQQLPRTRSAATSASGAGPESNAWARAQVSLADLRSHRSDAAIALGDLDLMFVDATLSFTQREAVAAARDEAAAMVAEQDRNLGQLYSMVAL